MVPRAGHAVDPEDLVFQWTPPEPGGRPATYRLVVYRYQSGIPIPKVLKGKPVYAADKLKTPHHKFSGRSGTLKKDTAYIWRVEALDKENRVMATSEVQGFRFAPAPSITLDPDMAVRHPHRAGPPGRAPSRAMGPGTMATTAGFDLSSFIPLPPLIWGCPVSLRPLASLPETPPSIPPAPPEEPGDVEHLAFIWGSEAARLYLIPSLCRHAHISWDYRYLTGCEQVLLQIAGEDGFRLPNAEDARADPGVRTWYTGPAFIDPAACGSYELNLKQRGISLDTCADNLNIISTGALELLSPDFYYLRLAPLDAAGNQIGPASDHVSVVLVEYPGIEQNQFVVQWFWGENPFRRIYLSIYLRGAFPSLYPLFESVNAPTTFIIWTGTGSATGMPDIVDTSSLEANGTPISLKGTWFGKDAYFMPLDRWVSDAVYGFYVDQTCTSLLNLTNINFGFHCIPGLSPAWRICRGRMPDDNRPPIGSVGSEPCESPALGIDIVAGYEGGLLPIYHLFTRRLSGRRVSSRDGEQPVTVRFDFSEAVPTVREFRAFLFRHGPHPTGTRITMLETRDGTERSYDFRWHDFYTEIMDIEDQGRGGATPLYAGRLVYDPPRLEMHFDGLDYFLTTV
jgi:hypothetical protein